MEQEFRFVKLHDVPDLTEKAACLLNSEWPRSLEARCHIIRRSSDDLPCSFLLLKVSTDTNAQTVVGFSRLSKVLQKPKSVLVESVIVDKTLRGHGLGKMIMKQTEDFAQKYGYETMHLSTHDKHVFYEHLGYSLSSPVSAETKVARFLSKSQVGVPKGKEVNSIKICNIQTSEMAAKSSQCETESALSIPPPPPPLPLPKMSPKTSKSVASGSKVWIWMEKCLN